MAADFELKDREKYRTMRCTKESGVTIEAGDIVTLTTGLIVKAGAGSTTIAFCEDGAESTQLYADVSIGNDFTLVGKKDADANFAVTQKGTLCDLKGTTDLIIDNDTSSTNVFQIDASENAGTAGSKANIVVRINKPLF